MDSQYPNTSSGPYCRQFYNFIGWALEWNIPARSYIPIYIHICVSMCMRLQLKTMPLSDFQGQRIISLWTQADGERTMTEIKKILALKGTITTHQTIRNTISRWQDTGSIKDCPRIGQAKTIPLSHYHLIDEAMAENDERTAGDLKKLLAETFGEEKVTYSERTIARGCNELGWTFTTARYCQAIRDANKE